MRRVAGRGATRQVPAHPAAPERPPGQRVLEIGCGWGAFAETAAREAGLEVVGLTLSPAQLQFARRRMQLAGVEPAGDPRIARLSRPGRRAVRPHRFDRDVRSGRRTLVADLLRDPATAVGAGGRAMVQSITIRDDLFARYRRGTDFIQQHIFPGGMLPSPSVFGQQAARAGLVVRDALPSVATMRARWPNGRQLRTAVAGNRRAGFRRAFPSSVALLSGVLPGRLQQRLHRRHAVRTGARADENL
jgi:cyclopropane-fatty-acyl-phospholipid synthase